MIIEEIEVLLTRAKLQHLAAKEQALGNIRALAKIKRLVKFGQVKQSAYNSFKATTTELRNIDHNEICMYKDTVKALNSMLVMAKSGKV